MFFSFARLLNGMNFTKFRLDLSFIVFYRLVDSSSSVLFYFSGKVVLTYISFVDCLVYLGFMGFHRCVGVKLGVTSF